MIILVYTSPGIAGNHTAFGQVCWKRPKPVAHARSFLLLILIICFQCLLASSYIPFVTGTKVFTIEGVKYVDGGFSDNLPVLETGRTITVSPFGGKEDICPIDARSKAPHVRMGTMRVQVILLLRSLNFCLFLTQHVVCLYTVSLPA